MSSQDVDEVIDHILAEVKFFVPRYNRAMADPSVDSTTGILSVFVCLETRASTQRSYRTSLLMSSKLANSTSTMRS